MLDFKFHHRLSFKITVTLALILLCTSAVLGYFSLDVTRAGYHKLVRDQFRAAMNIVENYIDFMGQSTLILARHTANEEQVIAALEEPGKADVGAVLRQHAESIGADNILLLDNRGQVVAATLDPARVGQSLLSWRNVRQGLEQGEPGTSIVQEPDWFFVYSSAVVKGSGPDTAPLGLVLMGHALNERFIGNIRKNTDVDITVVRDRAIMVSTLEALKGLDPNLPMPYPEYRGLLNKRDSIREYRIGDSAYFISARRLQAMEQGMSGSLLLAYPRDRLAATEQHITQRLSLLFALGFLLVLIIGLRLSNTLVQRVRYLGEMTRRIAGGELESEIAIRSRDEFHWLAENFNRMRNAIREKNQALKAYSDNLEHLVDARTRELRETNANLKKSQGNLAEAQRIAGVGSWELDCGDGSLEFSDEFARLFSLEPGTRTSHQRLLEQVCIDDREEVEVLWRMLLDNPRPYTLDYRLQLPDNSLRHLHENAVLVVDTDGRPVRMNGTVQDISERVSLEEKIRHQATYDELTGLPNRVLFRDRLKRAMSRCERKSEQLALLFIDLDGFKPVNDRFGHDVGDLVLEQVGSRIAESVRTSDTAARMGGDEFTVILPEVRDDDTVDWIADKLLKRLSAPYLVSNRDIRVGASIGIAIYPRDAESAAELVKQADLSMYRAKEAGRNKVIFHSDFRSGS